MSTEHASPAIARPDLAAPSAPCRPPCYYETAHAGAWGASARSTVPTGVAVFPLDVSIRRTIELEGNVVHWSEFDRGGHFATMEAPEGHTRRTNLARAQPRRQPP